MKQFHESKLVKTFLTLTTKDRVDLDKWVRSPWSNSNAKLIKLYQLMNKANVDFSSKKFTDQALFTKIFGTKAFDPRQLNNLKSALVKSMENFLIHQTLQSNSEMKSELLRKAMLERNKIEAFENQSRQLIKLLKNKNVKDWEDHLQLCLLFESLYFIPKDKTTYRPEINDLQSAIENLDIFYAIGKSRMLEMFLKKSPLFHKTLKFENSLEILRLIKMEINQPAVDLYFIRFDQIENLNYRKFKKFKTQLLENFDQLPSKDKKVLLQLAINDAIKLNSKGILSVNEDLFNLYQFGISKGTLLHNNMLSPTAYANYIQIACSTNKPQYANAFIKNNTKLVPKEFRREALHWAQGQVEYTKGHYKSCINTIEKVKRYKHRTFGILSRSTLLKAYFDNSFKNRKRISFKLFDVFIYNFEHFMRRNTFLDEDRKVPYLNYIHYSNQLKLIPFLNQKEAEKKKKEIKKLVRKEKQIFAKQWILTKLEEL